LLRAKDQKRYSGHRGKEKNKEKNKHAYRRTSAVGGTGKETAFALVEHGGKARSCHVPDVTAKTLRPRPNPHRPRAPYRRREAYDAPDPRQLPFSFLSDDSEI
jgi:hypothetical protein